MEDDRVLDGLVSIAGSLTPLAVMILTITRSISPTMGPTRWLIRIGHEVGFIAVISGLVVFFDDNIIGPGEVAIAGVGVLVGLWLVAVGVTILNGGAAERVTRRSAFVHLRRRID